MSKMLTVQLRVIRNSEREGEQQAASGAQRQEQNRMLTGLFNDRESTDRAYSSLRDRGYTDDDINLMMADNTRDTWFEMKMPMTPNSEAKHLKVRAQVRQSAERSVLSSAESLPSEQMFLLPGLGLVVAGPLAAALAGAGAGGLTGGLVGALIGSGIPEDRANFMKKVSATAAQLSVSRRATTKMRHTLKTNGKTITVNISTVNFSSTF